MADRKISDLTSGSLGAADYGVIQRSTDNYKYLIRDAIDARINSLAALASHGHSVATTSVSGFMSAADKIKLDSIASGATSSGASGDAYAVSHESDTTAHTAANIVNVPAGNISAITVQAALNELDTEKQPIDATLTALAALATSADKFIYFTASDSPATATVTSFARSILDDTNGSGVLSTISGVAIERLSLGGVGTADSGKVPMFASNGALSISNSLSIFNTVRYVALVYNSQEDDYYIYIPGSLTGDKYLVNIPEIAPTGGIIYWNGTGDGGATLSGPSGSVVVLNGTGSAPSYLSKSAGSIITTQEWVLANVSGGTGSSFAGSTGINGSADSGKAALYNYLGNLSAKSFNTESGYFNNTGLFINNDTASLQIKSNRFEMTNPDGSQIISSSSGFSAQDVMNGRSASLSFASPELKFEKNGIFTYITHSDVTGNINVYTPLESGILATRTWVTANFSGGGSGASTLDGLSDVVITSPTSGQHLRYNGSNFVNTGVYSSDVLDAVSSTVGSADANKLLKVNSVGGIHLCTDATDTFAFSIEGTGLNDGALIFVNAPLAGAEGIYSRTYSGHAISAEASFSDGVGLHAINNGTGAAIKLSNFYGHSLISTLASGASYTVKFPNKSGIVAFLSDITGSSLSTGDKGDIIVSGESSWVFDPTVITTQTRGFLALSAAEDYREFLELGNSSTKNVSNAWAGVLDSGRVPLYSDNGSLYCTSLYAKSEIFTSGYVTSFGAISSYTALNLIDDQNEYYGGIYGPADGFPVDNAKYELPNETGIIATRQWALANISGGSGGISDGDKGDITVSSAGSVWTIDSGLSALKIADGSVSNTQFQYLSGVTSNIQTQFSNKQPLDSTLTALASYNTNGIIVQTAADTFVGRTISAGSGISVTDGNGVAGNPTISLNSNARLGEISFRIDGGGSAITTGAKKIYLRVGYDCTITGWQLVADQTGSISIDIWKDSYANFPPTVADTITASAKPSLSSAQKNESSTLTGWTTTLQAGDYLEVNIDSASTITLAILTLLINRT